MDHKKATAILVSMLDKYSLDAEEKEAVLTAIGVLGWTSLAQSRLRARREKREKRAEGDLKN